MIRSTFIAFALVATPVNADPLDDAVRADLPELVKLYTALHAQPELAFQERATAARLAAAVRPLGYNVVTDVGGTGVVATLVNGPGPVLLIRTDMDGLPVKEETGLPYASTATGRLSDGTMTPVMHACGHDIHMTTWVGTARRLAAAKAGWSGTLVLVAQPAEEIVRGAAALLKDGLYARFPKPTHVLAVHDSASLPAGTLGITDGPALANVDSVDIVVKGVGAHGSMPHFGRDPVVVAARIVTTLQTLVSRENDPFDPAVVTVGAINGGTKHNIIPEAVRLQITVRSYTPAVRTRLLDGIRRIALAEAAAAGMTGELAPEVTLGDRADATVNTPALTARVRDALRGRFGVPRVLDVPPSMAAEDFGQFSAGFPGVESTIFWVGAVKRSTWDAAQGDVRRLPSLHNARFAPDPEPTIATGVAALTTAALAVLASARRSQLSR